MALTAHQTPTVVWLVEDDPGYRTSISFLLGHTSGLSCPEAFGDCETALDLLDAYADRAKPFALPNVLLLDINLPGLNGLDAIEAFKQRLPKTQVVMLTIRDDPDTIYTAFAAGASGYLFKNANVDEIIEAVRQAARGGMLMPAPVASKVLSLFQQTPAPDDFGLSEREREVLAEMAEGYTQKEIAARLFVSPNTVNTHIQHIYAKLHVHCAPEAVAKAIRAGLI